MPPCGLHIKRAHQPTPYGVGYENSEPFGANSVSHRHFGTPQDNRHPRLGMDEFRTGDEELWQAFGRIEWEKRIA